MSASSKRKGAITLWLLVLTVFFILPGQATAAGTLSGDLAGKYDPFHIHVISLNMSVKF